MSMPTILPKARHTATVIFLHGLGDTGHGWCQGFEEIAEPFVKYLFPTAKIQPVTLNFGMKMPSWFDIKSLSFDADEDTAGIKQSSSFLRSLVQEELKNGISSERIIIGGFSQGGAVALHAAFTADVKFGGLVALSTWLPMHQLFPAASTGKNQATPIFQGHGDHDPVVPYKFGQMTHEYLKKMNSNPSFNTYRGMVHSSCEQAKPYPAPSVEPQIFLDSPLYLTCFTKQILWEMRGMGFFSPINISIRDTREPVFHKDPSFVIDTSKM